MDSLNYPAFTHISGMIHWNSVNFRSHTHTEWKFEGRNCRHSCCLVRSDLPKPRFLTVDTGLIDSIEIRNKNSKGWHTHIFSFPARSTALGYTVTVPCSRNTYTNCQRIIKQATLNLFWRGLNKKPHNHQQNIINQLQSRAYMSQSLEWLEKNTREYTDCNIINRFSECLFEAWI